MTDRLVEGFAETVKTAAVIACGQRSPNPAFDDRRSRGIVCGMQRSLLRAPRTGSYCETEEMA